MVACSISCHSSILAISTRQKLQTLGLARKGAKWTWIAAEATLWWYFTTHIYSEQPPCNTKRLHILNEFLQVLGVVIRLGNEVFSIKFYNLRIWYANSSGLFELIFWFQVAFLWAVDILHSVSINIGRTGFLMLSMMMLSGCWAMFHAAIISHYTCRYVLVRFETMTKIDFRYLAFFFVRHRTLGFWIHIMWVRTGIYHYLNSCLWRSPCMWQNPTSCAKLKATPDFFQLQLYVWGNVIVFRLQTSIGDEDEF